jgi:hypothetical protein
MHGASKIEAYGSETVNKYGRTSNLRAALHIIALNVAAGYSFASTPSCYQLYL